MTDTASTPRWIEKSVRDGECLRWTGAADAHGYGLVAIGGVTKRVHRLVYALHYDDDPPVVRHTCDHPWCIEPSHLRGGTQADNVADRVERGRSASWERNGRAVLTASIVREARARATAGEAVRALAREFGVHSTTMRSAVRGDTWK